jgi:hypothetical protein
LLTCCVQAKTCMEECFCSRTKHSGSQKRTSTVHKERGGRIVVGNVLRYKLCIQMGGVHAVVIRLSNRPTIGRCACKPKISRGHLHCCNRHDSLGQLSAKGRPRGVLLDHTHGQASTPATPTMNSATTLMTSHVLPGFNPNSINHELCHYTNDVACIARLQPQQHV